MPLRRHWVHFRCYDNSFTASEAVDRLHELLKRNHNFGPAVTRSQTIQLLRKFLKNHVIEDIKGRFGREDFDDNGHVYRFPPTSPLKQFPKRPLLVETRFLPKIPHLHNEEETTPKMIPINPVLLREKSESWNKRHSIAIGELHECKLIQRREITEIDMGQIWKSMTLARLQMVLGLMTLDGVLDTKLINPKYIVHNVYSVNKQGVVVLKDKSDDLPHWVLSAMKCLASWPNSSETMQPIYPGFEKDVLRTVADYFQKLKEPLLTFQLYEVFVNILSLKEQQVAVEALQVCCLLLSPANCRKLQLLLHLMARVCNNPRIPTLNSAIGTRTLMVQTFSCCILSSADEMELDELLATKLVTFMMDKHEEILKGPTHLQGLVEEHIAHLRRVQIKYAGAEDSLGSPFSCRQVKREEFKQHGTSITQGPTVDLLEDILKDKDLSIKEKKNKLKQFQKLYPEIYRRRLPTAESEAAVLREINQRPQLMLLKLRKPFQPFQRSWSFRA